MSATCRHFRERSPARMDGGNDEHCDREVQWHVLPPAEQSRAAVVTQASSARPDRPFDIWWLQTRTGLATARTPLRSYSLQGI